MISKRPRWGRTVRILVRLSIAVRCGSAAALRVGPISMAGCMSSLAIGFVPFTVLEIAKLIRRVCAASHDHAPMTAAEQA